MVLMEYTVTNRILMEYTGTNCNERYKWNTLYIEYTTILEYGVLNHAYCCGITNITDIVAESWITSESLLGLHSQVAICVINRPTLTKSSVYIQSYIGNKCYVSLHYFIC